MPEPTNKYCTELVLVNVLVMLVVFIAACVMGTLYVRWTGATRRRASVSGLGRSGSGFSGRGSGSSSEDPEARGLTRRGELEDGDM